MTVKTLVEHTHPWNGPTRQVGEVYECDNESVEALTLHGLITTSTETPSAPRPKKYRTRDLQAK